MPSHESPRFNDLLMDEGCPLDIIDGSATPAPTWEADDPLLPVGEPDPSSDYNFYDF